MKRSGPLRTKTPLKAKTPMRKVSRKKAQREASPEGQEDEAYLRKVRACPCIVCEIHGEPQLSPTEAHHPIHDRFSRNRRPDRDAIPLCNGHHTGDKDPSKIAIHKGKRTWRGMYGVDYDYIDATRDMIERMGLNSLFRSARL